jgi:hypothetical protein
VAGASSVAGAYEGASELLSANDCERNGFDRLSEIHVPQLPLQRWATDFGQLANP